MLAATTNPMDKNVGVPAGVSSSANWMIGGLLPVLWQPAAPNALAWGVAVAVGGIITREQLIRWVPLAWIVSILVPGTPLLAIAASGVVAGGRRECMYAALLGTVLCLIWIPGVLLNAGVVVVIVGCATAITRRD